MLKEFADTMDVLFDVNRGVRMGLSFLNLPFIRKDNLVWMKR